MVNIERLKVTGYDFQMISYFFSWKSFLILQNFIYVFIHAKVVYRFPVLYESLNCYVPPYVAYPTLLVPVWDQMKKMGLVGQFYGNEMVIMNACNKIRLSHDKAHICVPFSVTNTFTTWVNPCCISFSLIGRHLTQTRTLSLSGFSWNSKKYINPLYTNHGFFLLVWYNKLGIVHCTYLGVSG